MKEILRPNKHAPLLDTPFESPAEYEFAYHLVKYAADDTTIEKQHAAPTERGHFRLDFLLATGRRTLAIEIDGQPYHDQQRDAARDALILSSGHAHEIVRIRARGVVFHVEDVLYLLSEAHPSFFSARGRENLRILSTPYARLQSADNATILEVYYPDPDHDPDLTEDDVIDYDTVPVDWRERDLRIARSVRGEEFLGVVIERRSVGFGKSFVDFSRANPGLPFETLVSTYFIRS